MMLLVCGLGCSVYKSNGRKQFEQNAPGLRLNHEYGASQQDSQPPQQLCRTGTLADLAIQIQNAGTYTVRVQHEGTTEVCPQQTPDSTEFTREETILGSGREAASSI